MKLQIDEFKLQIQIQSAINLQSILNLNSEICNSWTP